MIAQHMVRIVVPGCNDYRNGGSLCQQIEELCGSGQFNRFIIPCISGNKNNVNFCLNRQTYGTTKSAELVFVIYPITLFPGQGETATGQTGIEMQDLISAKTLEFATY